MVIQGSKRFFWWMGAGISVALVVALVSSCAVFSPPTPIPTAADVVGTWVHTEQNHPPVTLVMRADVTFSIDAIPGQVFDILGRGPLDWGNLIPLTGTWTVVEKRRDAGPYINFDIAARPDHVGIGTQLYVSGTGENMKFEAIYASKTVDDNRFEFFRAH